MLCTGWPYFLFTFNRLSLSLCLALLSAATAAPVCMCVNDDVVLPPLGLPYLLLSLHARPALPPLHALPALPSFPAPPVLSSSLTALNKSCTCLCVIKANRNRSIEKWYFTPVLTCSNPFTPLHTSVTMSARQLFLQFSLSKAVTTSYTAEIAYFSSSNREICNGVRLV